MANNRKRETTSIRSKGEHRSDALVSALIAELKKLGVRPTRERGQNFLIDPSAVQKIVDFGKPRESEVFIEIGPGLGALTAELLNTSATAVIEIEENFCRYLSRKLPTLEIVNEDIRFVSLSEIAATLQNPLSSENPLPVVFGNLPYSLSSEIIFVLLAQSTELSRAVLMLQREFVGRLSAKPGGKEYSSLSIAVQMYADVRSGPVIGPESFFPVPRVHSQLIELRFLKSPRFDVPDRLTFTRLVQACFFKRRRMILNSIKASAFMPELDWAEILNNARISPEARAETIEIKDYARLASELHVVVGDL